jgi:chromate reductase
MPEPIQVLGFAGSLRKDSYNLAALRAAQELLPPDMSLAIFDLAPIPMYNEDVRVLGFPPPVEAFRQQIYAADAVLIATPEYNSSIPGVLKNAIDWASRAPDPPFNGKPVAWMGASTGGFGTARAQLHLLQICANLNMLPLNRPRVLITHAREKFIDGQLVDENTRGQIRAMLEGLADWTRRVRC